MATIVSTTNDFSLSSSFTCTTVFEQRTVPSTSSSITDMYTSSASTGSQAVTFTYDSLSGETINMAVLTFAGSNSAYGGAVYVDDTQVYQNNNTYTFYLDPTMLGTTSTSFNFKFKSYTVAHNHLNDYDSKTLVSSSGGTSIYHYKKSHRGNITLSSITLKIYTGEDFVSAPSTSALLVGVDGVAKKVTDMFVGVNGVAKKVSEGWIGVNGIARKFWPCLELKDVPAGSIIQLDEAGDGTLVDYIVVAQNHYLNETNTEDHTVFMRKNVLSTKVGYGNNTSGESYIGEELDNYINDTWKASLDGRIILKLMNITIPCTKWSNPYKTTAERQIWVPARGEIDPSFSEKYTAVCFPYFENITTNADRIAYNDSGTATAWWTRSCVEGTNPYVRVVTAAGGYTNYSQKTKTGVRPVFCLPNSLPVSLISEGQYDLIL